MTMWSRRSDGLLTLQHLSWATLAIVMLSWALFAVAFLLRRRLQRRAEQSRDRSSLLAMAIQGAGFALVWGLRRPFGTPLVPIGMLGALALLAIAAILGIGSAVLVMTSIRTLGKQWSLAARVLEGHALITSGPYGWVRHPIYTALFGMLLATGLALSQWQALVAGSLLYLLGTFTRIRIEERLLRQSFGEAYERYISRVPAFLPWPCPN
jgi:protein-S-isoprenylcysteine O-methyltransferase Ste14